MNFYLPDALEREAASLFKGAPGMHVFIDAATRGGGGPTRWTRIVESSLGGWMTMPLGHLGSFDAVDVEDPATQGAMLYQVEAVGGFDCDILVHPAGGKRRNDDWSVKPVGWRKQIASGRTRGAALVAAMQAVVALKRGS